MNNINQLIISNMIRVPYINDELDDFIYKGLTIVNPQWLENRKMGRWNRDTPKELYFYEEQKNICGDYEETELYAPRGFLKNILEYCKRNNIQIDINDQTRLQPTIDFNFFGKLRPFQQTAVQKMLSENIGTLCAATGSGKTTAGLYIIAKRKQPTIILVHTKELLYQWVDRIKQFLNIDKEDVGIIGDGNIDSGKDIAVALVQTLRKCPEQINDYSQVIIDENHRIPSKTHTNIVSQFDGRYILGLSATPYRRDGLTKAIEWYAGPIIHKVDQKDLIEKKYITSIEPIIIRTNFAPKLKDPSAEYSKLMQEISQDKERNETITNDIIDAYEAGEICLVLSDRKAHCQKLYDIVSSKTSARIAILTGDTPTIERKQIVEDINKGKIKILIVTGQLIGEGFDCKNLSALFLTMPVSFAGRIIQYIGRVLRPAKNKEKALVYDYFDENVRCLHQGFKTRKKIYEKLVR